jgi:hypothetical protein
MYFPMPRPAIVSRGTPVTGAKLDKISSDGSASGPEKKVRVRFDSLPERKLGAPSGLAPGRERELQRLPVQASHQFVSASRA